MSGDHSQSTYHWKDSLILAEERRFVAMSLFLSLHVAKYLGTGTPLDSVHLRYEKLAMNSIIIQIYENFMLD